MKLHIETPLIESLSVGKNLPGNIWLKMDALQPCGSFKVRGVGYACEKYVQNGAKELVSSSGGNAGLAVAYCGRRLGIPVTVIVPKTTKKRAVDLIKLEGAQVVVRGDVWSEAHEHAMELSKKEAAYIHPFDDPYLWKGHSSVIDEIFNERITPDAVVLSVGGGGLLCGVVEGLNRNNLNDVPVIAVETQGTNSLSTAFMANKHIGIENITSIATSLGAAKIAEHAFDLRNDHPIISQVVTDRDAVNGCYRFLEDHRLIVEPACGASLSVVYNECDALQDKENIVVIVCGGVGVTIGQLEKWKQQAM